MLADLIITYEEFLSEFWSLFSLQNIGCNTAPLSNPPTTWPHLNKEHWEIVIKIQIEYIYYVILPHINKK